MVETSSSVFPGLQALWIHDSQSPEAVAESRQRSLLTGQIDHQFHYASPYQTQLWQAVHKKYAPIVTQAPMMKTYDDFSKKVAETLSSGTEIHVIGLGAGGAQKDRLLLEAFRIQGKKVRFTPLDVSPALSLLSSRHTQGLCAYSIYPIVADLTQCHELPLWLNQMDGGMVPRLFTVYGLLPNFEPKNILPLLHVWLRPQDRLAMSANLVPGDMLAPGMNLIRSQYDNPETEQWLRRVLIDWGLEQETEDYHVGSVILDSGTGRFEASVNWIKAHSQTRRLLLFFSYRYTESGIRKLIKNFHFQPLFLSKKQDFIDPSGQEGVWFLKTEF